MTAKCTTLTALSVSMLILAAPYHTRAQRGPVAKASGVGHTKDQEPEVTLRELREGETVRFPAPAPGIILNGIQCGENGDIFLVFGTDARAVMNSPNGSAPLPIQRISVDSQTLTAYAVSSLGDYQVYRRSTFTMDDRGAVYALYTAFRHGKGLGLSLELERRERPDNVVVKFHDDGSVDSRIQLSDPPNGSLEPTLFGVFGDGQLLVTGTVNVLGQLKPFTGIFDRSGRFEQQLSLTKDVEPSSGANHGDKELVRSGAAASAQKSEEKTPRKPLPPNTPVQNWQTAMAYGKIFSGSDGNLYLLRASIPPRVYVVSSDGRAVREFLIQPPEPGLRLLDLHLAGQRNLFAEFIGPANKKMGFSGSLVTISAVIDDITGKVIAAYRFPPNVGLLPGCAAGPDTFEFLGSTKDHKLKVVRFRGG